MGGKKRTGIDDVVEEKREHIIGMLSTISREGIEDLIDWLDETDFFEAPASTHPEKHGCREGGLAAHSLHVYNLFEEKRLKYGFDLSQDESLLASICHDFCKIDIYKPNFNKDGSRSKKPYVIHDEFPFGHGEKSVVLVQRHIDLTQKEQLLMRWHMGPYDPAWEMNRSYVERVCPEIYAFHFSDHEASLYLDEKVKKGGKK